MCPKTNNKRERAIECALLELEKKIAKKMKKKLTNPVNKETRW